MHCLPVSARLCMDKVHSTVCTWLFELAASGVVKDAALRSQRLHLTNKQNFSDHGNYEMVLQKIVSDGNRTLDTSVGEVSRLASSHTAVTARGSVKCIFCQD